MITLIGGNVQNASGLVVPFGSLSLQLNCDATIVADPFGIIPGSTAPVAFSFDENGDLEAGAQIYSNAELNPQNSRGLGTYYLVTFYDPNGARLNSSPMWWQFPQAANSTVDISQMTPYATVGGNVIFYPTSILLPAPTPSSLGGVFSNAGQAKKFVVGITTSGTLILAPAPGTLDWINVVLDYGADPTGVADSSTAIIDAITAGGIAGVPVFFPAGLYKMATGISGITPTPPALIGDGSQNSILVNASSDSSPLLALTLSCPITIQGLQFQSDGGSVGYNSEVSLAGSGRLFDVSVTNTKATAGLNLTSINLFPSFWSVDLCNVTSLGLHQFITGTPVSAAISNTTATNGFIGSDMDCVSLVNCTAGVAGVPLTNEGFTFTNGVKLAFVNCQVVGSTFAGSEAFDIDAGVGQVEMCNCSTTATNSIGIGFFIQGKNIRLNNLTASGVQTGMYINFASNGDGSVIVENCVMSPTPGHTSTAFEVSLSGSPTPLGPLTFINCQVPGLDSGDRPFDFVAVPATTPITLIGCKVLSGSQAGDVFTSTPSQVTILSCNFPAGTSGAVINVPGLVTAPSTDTSAGVPNQIAYDGSFFYVCTAANTWRRAAISTF